MREHLRWADEGAHEVGRSEMREHLRWADLR